MAKILAVKPIYGGSYPVMGYAIRALQQLGHDVTVVDFSPLLSLFQYIKTTSDSAAARLLKETASRTLFEAIDNVHPDILFGIAQAPIFSSVLRLCKQRGILRVFWFVEDFERFAYWQKIASLYDFFFVIQKEPLINMLKKLGTRPFYLPLAADVSIHRPLLLSEDERREYGSTVSFVGAGYPNRITIFERLDFKDFKIWGSDWNLTPGSPLIKVIQKNGTRVSVEEYVKIFNASVVNLNLHSSTNPQEIGKGDFVNPRTFEIAACRAFQVVDSRSLLGELYAEDELAVCRTVEEMKHLVDSAIKDEAWRLEIASKGYRRTLKEHTYLHRMAELIRIVKEHA
ncbi:MAG: glycosyltransferase [Thermodesulforhabdaceae bacterium]